MLQRAVFLDKDGTLIEDIPYNVNPDRIQLTSGAGPALQQLQTAGYRLIIITNQSGVARGYFQEQDLVPVFQRLQQLLVAYEVSLDGFYYCPHHPQGTIAQYSQVCSCRKPEPGMLFQAAQAHQIDLVQSWFIGDILNDVEAGNRAGCRTILLNNGNETEWQMSPHRSPDFMVTDLTTAAQIILQYPALKSSSPSLTWTKP